MNRQIAQLFGLAAVLFALLVAFTTRWAVAPGSSLADAKPLNAPEEGLLEAADNRRALIEEQKIPRGLILASDGETVLADNIRRGAGDDTIFTRTYPTGPLFSHAVGYSFIERGRSGLEKSRNDALAGEEDEFESIFTQLRSREREGRDVVTTLDADGQRAALAALGGRRGSVVAIEPQTGRIRVMASVPDFDPNDVPERFGELTFLNRATQARYPPGSTFKVVTAAAALDSGRFSPDSVLDGSSPQTIGGVALENFGGQDFGPVSLTEALTNSVNTVWGTVGQRLGKRTMIRYMERFGFGQDPPLDYPPEQMTPSGIFQGGRLLDAGDAIDIGRVAIGQERLQVTPLQMAMVAAAVGNDGQLMRPRLVERTVAKDGRVERVPAEGETRVISKKAADQLGSMMADVVSEGSGTAAALSGIEVAGKTGTAEVEGGASNQAWFIAFAPVDNPRMAIAATVERTQGQGGTVAAPLAKVVLEELLDG